MALKTRKAISRMVWGVSLLFVNPDAVAPGERGKPERPFSTCTAAKNAAQAGDTIIVTKGTFNEWNLGKHLVNWEFYPGAGIHKTTNAPGGIYDDSSFGANQAMEFTVNGDFFKCTGGQPSGSILTVAKNGSKVTFKCRYMEVSGVAGEGCCVLQDLEGAAAGQNNLLFCWVDEISTDSIAYWWRNGDGFFINPYCHSNQGGAASVPWYYTCGTAAAWLGDQPYVKGECVVLNGITYCEYGTPVRCASDAAGGAARIWMYFGELICDDNGYDGNIWVNGCKFYGVGQKVKDNSHPTGGTGTITVQGGDCYLFLQKVESTKRSAIWCEGGNYQIEVQEINAWTADNSAEAELPVMAILAGTGTVRVNNVIGSAWQDGLWLAEGSARISGLINTSAAAGKSPIRVISGPGPVCKNLELLSHATQPCVTADDPQSMNVIERTVSANTDKHANVTVLGGEIARPVAANKVYAGPVAGGATWPAMRSLVLADMPAGLAGHIGAAVLAGGNNFTGAQQVTGTANAVQMKLRMFAGQTADPFQVTDPAGTGIFARIQSNGAMDAGGFVIFGTSYAWDTSGAFNAATIIAEGLMGIDVVNSGPILSNDGGSLLVSSDGTVPAPVKVSRADIVGGAEPGTPVEGMIYFNSTTKRFMGYVGAGGWKQLDN